MSQAAFALELSEVVNGILLVRSQHSGTVQGWRPISKSEIAETPRGHGSLSSPNNGRTIFLEEGVAKSIQGLYFEHAFDFFYFGLRFG